jgi:hypothetical protein
MLPWVLDPVERGGTARFPYADVREIRLSFDPTRFDQRRYRCDLRMKDGRKTTLFSTTYVGVGDFADCAASYVPLVRGLVARVAGANPGCRFRAGRGRVAYFVQHAFLFVAFAALVFVLFAFGGSGLSDLVWLKLAIVASYIPVMASYTRKNWPRRFMGAAVPEDVLPRVESKD